LHHLHIFIHILFHPRLLANCAANGLHHIDLECSIAGLNFNPMLMIRLIRVSPIFQQCKIFVLRVFRRYAIPRSFENDDISESPEIEKGF